MQQRCADESWEEIFTGLEQPDGTNFHPRASMIHVDFPTSKSTSRALTVISSFTILSSCGHCTRNGVGATVKGLNLFYPPFVDHIDQGIVVRICTSLGAAHFLVAVDFQILIAFFLLSVRDPPCRAKPPPDIEVTPPLPPNVP